MSESTNPDETVVEAMHSFSFTSLGSEWHLSPVVPAIRNAYATWCKKRGRRGLSANKGVVSDAEYADDLERFRQACEAGLYSWGTLLNPRAMGSAVRNIMSCDEGFTHLVGLLLSEKHGELEQSRVVDILGGADSAAVAAAVTSAIG